MQSTNTEQGSGKPRNLISNMDMDLESLFNKKLMEFDKWVEQGKKLDDVLREQRRAIGELEYSIKNAEKTRNKQLETIHLCDQTMYHLQNELEKAKDLSDVEPGLKEMKEKLSQYSKEEMAIIEHLSTVKEHKGMLIKSICDKLPDEIENLYKNKLPKDLELAESVEKTCHEIISIGKGSCSETCGCNNRSLEDVGLEKYPSLMEQIKNLQCEYDDLNPGNFFEHSLKQNVQK